MAGHLHLVLRASAWIIDLDLTKTAHSVKELLQGHSRKQSINTLKVNSNAVNNALLFFFRYLGSEHLITVVEAVFQVTGRGGAFSF